MNKIGSEHRPDYFMIACFVILILFGLVMLGSASANLGETKFEDTYYYLKHQIYYGIIPGLIGAFVASKIYFGKYEKAAPIILIASIALLVLLFSPLGLRAGGALRWLSIGGLTFQPIEFAKVGIIIYFATWLASNRERQESWHKGLIPFVSILGVIGAILFKQSSTSVFAIIVAAACIMYFASGARMRYLLIAAILAVGAIIAISYATPYRWSRLMAYVNPEANQETSGYHINQALIAIGSGGWSGVGLGMSTTKIKYLPEPIGDSIFAVVAEELGFLGAMSVVILFALTTARIILLATKTNNTFGQLLLIGFGGLIGIQAFVNIGAISGLIPLTGMPLPLMSYGGTALAVTMTIGGMIINISKYTRNT